MADPDLHVFWHDDALLHDTGSGVFEQPALAADRGVGAAPRERRADPEHPLLPARGADRAAAGLAGRPPRDDRRAGDAARPRLRRAGARVLRGRRRRAGRPARSSPPAPGRRRCRRPAPRSPRSRRCWTATACAAYALVRPPGHHAQPARTDGYCLFSNTALAAEAAVRRGVERVAIIDWDVHHGNGTQECFYDRGDVLSGLAAHAARLLGAGAPPDRLDARGRARRRRRATTSTSSWPTAAATPPTWPPCERVVTPILDHFRPGLILIAAGPGRQPVRPQRPPVPDHGGFRRLGELAQRAGRPPLRRAAWR